tara:strand:- start:3713 stop:3907 length:195 start_codon:yes stop_codon:yes gene_type:complete
MAIKSIISTMPSIRVYSVKPSYDSIRKPRDNGSSRDNGQNTHYERPEMVLVSPKTGPCGIDLMR